MPLQADRGGEPHLVFVAGRRAAPAERQTLGSWTADVTWMKQLAVIVSLILTVTVGGCARRMYRWNSDVGQRCFYECKSRFHQCNAYCFGNLGCQFSCDSAEEACMAACPDLVRER
jgi:hypothetical protein